MYPTLEKVKEIAASGEYRRIPVCKELYADRYTPVEVMRVLRKASKHCYLLESASQTEVWGRFSFLGYEPAMEITCTDGVLNIRKTGEDMVVTKKVEHPGDTLREIIEQYKTPVMEELPPFTGGLVGYFSYDYIKYSEQKLKLEDKEQQDFRDMDLMLFDQVIAFDHYRQKVLLITGVMTDDLEASYQKAEGKLEEMAQLLKTGPHMEFEKLKLESDIRPQFPEAEYCEMVEKAKHYIREGDIFQVARDGALTKAIAKLNSSETAMKNAKEAVRKAREIRAAYQKDGTVTPIEGLNVPTGHTIFEYLGFMTPAAFQSSNLDPVKTAMFTYKNTAFYTSWIKKS